MDDAGIYAREFEPLGRAVEIGVAGGKVVGVSFPETAPTDAESDHPLLDRIDDYLAGASDHFDDVPVALTVPTDQRRVLDAVRKLPYGETVRRSRVANLAGFDGDDEDDLRLVAEALRENPVPLFVPDHRVEGVRGATPGDVAEALRRLERD
ncbi:methylated-DNA--[protein]-cysteine S-methyltransferase [Salinirubrum litoreum]|uniref:Methylated-DNA--[protein]-cysteine S-methyltransferase n=1 Tax=Salinirubrum litoreum TaxID=1126234 RepID=A0ABD5RBZ9_9EURY|nr:MGMT family protein [Salinirubrum litoreum]